MARYLKCPKCKSTNVDEVSEKKKVSITKGLIGGALLGPLGAAAGALNGKKKHSFHCKDCGCIFEEKV